MPAKLTLYPPQRAARFVIIREGESLTVGRDPGCALVIEDPRVSKRHAEVRWTGASWAIEDLGSKNGTAVNGRAPDGITLGDGDTISFGGLPGRFDRLSAAEAASIEAERVARIETSARIRRRLQSTITNAENAGSIPPDVAATLEADLTNARQLYQSGAIRDAIEAMRPTASSRSSRSASKS